LEEEKDRQEQEMTPRRNLDTKTLNAGSALLIMCVNDTATLDMLTVAAT